MHRRSITKALLSASILIILSSCAIQPVSSIEDLDTSATQSCSPELAGTVDGISNPYTSEYIDGTTTEDLQQFADRYNSIRVSNCIEPVSYENFRTEKCMLERLIWMAEDPSTDSTSAWGHMGVKRSDNKPSEGCDGNLAGGAQNTPAEVAEKWWNSTDHRESLYQKGDGCVYFAMTHGGIPNESHGFTRAIAAYKPC